LALSAAVLPLCLVFALSLNCGHGQGNEMTYEGRCDIFAEFLLFMLLAPAFALPLPLTIGRVVLSLLFFLVRLPGEGRTNSG
jgi:hypothetical protein